MTQKLSHVVGFGLTLLLSWTVCLAEAQAFGRKWLSFKPYTSDAAERTLTIVDQAQSVRQITHCDYVWYRPRCQDYVEIDANVTFGGPGVPIPRQVSDIEALYQLVKGTEPTHIKIRLLGEALSNSTNNLNRLTTGQEIGAFVIVAAHGQGLFKEVSSGFGGPRIPTYEVMTGINTYIAHREDLIRVVDEGFYQTHFANAAPYVNGLERLQREGYKYDHFGVFDEEFYLDQNPDVANAVQMGVYRSGFDHYRSKGRGEGRPPYFDEAFYRTLYADADRDIADGKYASAYDHYQNVGKLEKRFTYYDESYYLAKTTDTLLLKCLQSGRPGSICVTSPTGLQHFLKIGRQQGQSPAPPIR